jgi:hypothetical protein
MSCRVGLISGSKLWGGAAKAGRGRGGGGVVAGAGARGAGASAATTSGAEAVRDAQPDIAPSQSPKPAAMAMRRFHMPQDKQIVSRSKPVIRFFAGVSFALLTLLSPIDACVRYQSD